MIKTEQIIQEIVLAFASQRQWQDAEKFISKNPDVEAFYDEFVVNRSLAYFDVIKMINSLEDKIPRKFKDQFIKYHKTFKEKQKQLSKSTSGWIVAKIDKFTIINKYKNLSRDEDYKHFRAVIDFIKKVTKTLKSKGYGLIIYGDIYLQEPRGSNTIAEYNYIDDNIILRLYRNYSDHAEAAMYHELAHRIWYQLFNYEDKKKWKEEYYAKMQDSRDFEKYFPRQYSKKNEEEYFATVVEEYLMTGDKYSELLDDIF